MPLPDKVIEQGKLADELEAQLHTPPTEPVTETPAAEEQPAPDAPKTPDAPAPEEETWERRFRVLQGKYNAEVPALHRKVKELEAQLAAKDAAPPEKLVKPEEVEQYGQEFIDMVQRAAREMIDPERKQLTDKIAALEAQLQGASTVDSTAAEAEFYADLAHAHPDWEAINQDKKFLTWLGQFDPRARRQRQQLIDEALAVYDSRYVIEMIAEWKSLNKVVRPATSDTSPAPATQKTDSPPTENKKTWTRAEMNAFYAKWSKGDIQDEEAVRIEQEINAAVAEGRIR